MINIYEGTIKLYLLKDIFNSNYQEKIAAVIDKSFTITEDMKSFHHRKEFKGYVFNGFHSKDEKSKNSVYKEGSVYAVKIRSIDENLMKFFKNNLAKTRTDEMQALTFEYRVLPKNIISKIYSITPAVCKFEDGYWRKSHTIEDIKNKIEQNARGKAKQLLGEILDENIEFIKSIKLLNTQYPIVREYKRKAKDSNSTNSKIKLLCDKFEFEIFENENAQKLANIIIGTGLLEMNARGFGYVNFKTI